MKIKISVDLKVGRVVKYFILVDLTLIAGWGLIDPILSVFIIDRIAGATLVTVGISSAIYWITKSALQLPVANYLDKNPGETDDIKVLTVGLLIAAFSAFSFGLITKTWQLYLVQLIKAIGFACYVPSWSAIFSRHLDKERVSFDWSLDSTIAGLAAGVSAFLGGAIAGWNFTAVFVFAGILTATSALVLLGAPDLILPKRTTPDSPVRDRTPIPPSQ